LNSMRLIITEKPSMGRDVAAVLGAARRGEGFIEGRDDIITWCVGHLVELDDPDSYDAKLKQWRMETLPILPESFKYHPSERTKDQFRVIKELLGRKDVTKVVNAADAGREGELIFDLVYTLSGCRKPVQRLWISSLTHDSIVEGFNNLKPADDYKGLRDSAHARQQADWLVGMNATRAQTIRARQSGHDGVYSLGRVQTPTLALIVGRDHEIATFVPVNYFEVAADFEAAAGAYRGLWFSKEGTRFDRKETAEAVASKVAGKPGKIEKVEKKATRERPPLLYDLTALQRAANARYAFTAAHTLEVAQTLYEKKFITYPRTSSRHLSRSVNEEIKGHVEAARFGPYVEFIEKILSGEPVKLTSRHVDDKKVTDHHAVIPTKQRVNAQALSTDEKRIYDLVVRRFLAAFYEDAELERTTIITEAEGERFITRGTVVLKAGWRVVDPPGRERRADAEEENDDAELPPVVALENVKTTRAEVLSKQTKAPPRYTESSLLGAMETAGKKVDDEELRLAMKDSGLGTPATRAAIIETLLKREYVTREKKSLVATGKGVALIKMLPSTLLKSAELTGRWEQKLSLMARGEYALSVFINEVKDVVRDLVKQIATAAIESGSAPSQRREVARPVGALDCPKCKHEARAGFLVERSGANGKFIVCALGREACGFISDLPKNAKQRKAMLQTACHVCGGAMRLRLPRDKGRKVSLCCSQHPRCQGVRWFNQENALEEPAAPAETGPACPLCKTPTLKRGPASSGNYFWSCPQWRSDGSGCNSKPIWINSASR
jgi:DNA topoisomerase-3